MVICIIGFSLVSCKKLVEVELPSTSISDVNVYSNDATAASVLNGIYAKISNATLQSGGLTSMSVFPSLSADELIVYNANNQSNKTYSYYYTNSLTSSNTGNSNFWNNIYPLIYVTNAAIEGLSKSTDITPSVKMQLLGEAKFLRAFCYFHLVNLYGDVPLALSTDQKVNRVLNRTNADEVYKKIIEDLEDAQRLLNNDYLGDDMLTISSERTIPNKSVATALLSRVYLFNKDYRNAEAQASLIIGNTILYDTVALDKVFLKNSMEAIWQLKPVYTSPSTNTRDARLFILPSTGPNVTGTYPLYLSDNVVNSFEVGDNRKIEWVNKVVVGGITYYYPYKYKSALAGAPVTEYLMVLRLAEQYLIRAEARALQGNLPGAVSDLNIIRRRAGLSELVSTNQADILSAIMQERKVELFTEWGHRWFDLKRTNKIDSLMNVVAAQKGIIWNSNWALYPIPQYEVDKNPSLTSHQNPGY
jgi:hypothetical protein